MKFTIDVKDFGEARAIKAALADSELRALILLTGLLKPLTQDERARVLNEMCVNFGPHGRMTNERT